jgi:hypothetical protein
VDASINSAKLYNNHSMRFDAVAMAMAITIPFSNATMP